MKQRHYGHVYILQDVKRTAFYNMITGNVKIVPNNRVSLSYSGKVFPKIKLLSELPTSENSIFKNPPLCNELFVQLCTSKNATEDIHEFECLLANDKDNSGNIEVIKPSILNRVLLGAKKLGFSIIHFRGVDNLPDLGFLRVATEMCMRLGLRVSWIFNASAYKSIKEYLNQLFPSIFPVITVTINDIGSLHMIQEIIDDRSHNMPGMLILRPSEPAYAQKTLNLHIMLQHRTNWMILSSLVSTQNSFEGGCYRPTKPDLYRTQLMDTFNEPNCLLGRAFVDTNGNLSPCPAFSKYVVGNINDKPLHKLIPDLQKTKQKLNKTLKCNDCALKYACTSCAAMVVGGDSHD